MNSMNEHSLATFFKGFFAASLAATATLFAVDFVRQAVHSEGITPASLATGVLVAFVHLVFILGFSVLPAALVVYTTTILQVRFAGVFVLCGAGISWLVLRVIPPWPDTASWPFVVAGLAAGGTYWFVSVRQRQGEQSTV
ncbi:hypothetical protein [Bradyrhizobium sp. USDA 336]|uniref:hypothetical protein n=1 Tax=Bradyrhizobium sp. USDA 336 TaxID=3156311 RepID=UPI00383529DC